MTRVRVDGEYVYTVIASGQTFAFDLAAAR
jgi:hypothetical protein